MPANPDQLQLDKSFYIRETSSDKKLAEAPPWVKFLINIGYHLNRKADYSRLITVILFPERYLCSGFLALGAILRGASHEHEFINWENFKSLSEGDKVFILYDSNGKLTTREAKVGSFYDRSGLLGRWIAIVPQKKSEEGTSYWITKDNIKNYRISRFKHASTIKLGKLNKNAKLLSRLSSSFSDSWIIGNSIESFIVTNKAEWTRQVDDIELGLVSQASKKPNSIPLGDLLMLSQDDQSSSFHTFLTSPSSMVNKVNTDLVILDGKEALAEWEKFSNSNLIICLSRLEFDDEQENTLSMLSNFRDSNLSFELPKEVLDLTPGSVEIALFSLPKSGN